MYVVLVVSDVWSSQFGHHSLVIKIAENKECATWKE